MTVEISSLINQYVESLKEEGWIQSEAVEAAFRRVPRHLLIEKVFCKGSLGKLTTRRQVNFS